MIAPSFDRSEAHALADLATLYDLVGELGRGGSAVVYRARDRRLDREVALKVVRLAPALDARERSAEVERLAREARTIARLTHPHVVAVYAVHELGDGLAVAMQYVRGRTLKQLVADEGALPPARAVALVRDVAAALAYAHAHGLVHRDVKPENIFVDDATGRALLADFGAARGAAADVRVTRTGMTIGTPAYMSPEQIDDAPLDGRSDLYSLGLVAWEALTGRRPWQEAGLYQLLHHQKHDTLPPIGAVRPAGAPPVPLAVEYVVERLLEKRPGARWADADALAAQLAQPVLPADFPLWKRAHERRTREWARGAAESQAAAAPSSGAPTEQWRATARASDTPAPRPARAAPADDAPSWTEDAADARAPRTGRRAWVAGGGAAALAVAGVVFARRAPATAVIKRHSVAVVRPADTARTTALPATPTQRAPIGAPTPPAPGRSPVAVASVPVAAPENAPAPARTRTPAAPALVAAPAAPPVAAPAAVPLDRTVIAAGARHSCALDAAGHAACWGDNASGQLGTGDLTPHDTPTPVAGELRFVQLTTGGAHSCGLTTDGDAYCWGEDEAGQLGDATTSLRDAPVRVAGTARFRSVRAGLESTCAITASATVLCWGTNARGELGDGTTRPRATPAPVAGLRATALAVGWHHACALTPDGIALCWGDNTQGQLGDNTRSARLAPVEVSGGFRFTAIAAGASQTCATAVSGATYCWGAVADGAAHPTPTRVDGAPPFVALVAGSVHTCGRTAAGALYCWGRNSYGQLGDGTTTDHGRPTRVPGGPFTAVSASGAHTCAVAATVPLCWGYNVAGQLGDGSRTHHATPTRVQRTST